MKKNDNIYLVIGIILIVAGIVGYFANAGYFLWLSAAGATITILRRKTSPKILGDFFSCVGIIVLLFFVFLLIKAFL